MKLRRRLVTALCFLVLAAAPMRELAAQTDAAQQMEIARQIQKLMEAGKEQEAIKLYQQLIQQQFHGKIELAGHVVDEHGQQLHDVRMVIKVAHMADMRSHELETSEQEVMVSGSFDYACDACAAVTLTFKKDGYYREKLEFVSYADEYPDRHIVKQDVKVVLQKRGVPAVLEPYTGSLIVSQSETYVLPFSFGPTSREMPLSLLPKMAASRKKFHGEVHYLALQVQRTATGDVAIQEARRGGVARGFSKPVNPVLDFSKADGGAILYQPQNTHFGKILREMRQAPLSGYKTSLALDVNTDRTQFFYCRIGKHYCRGTIEPIAIEKTSRGRRARVHVSIKLNTTEDDTNLAGY